MPLPTDWHSAAQSLVEGYVSLPLPDDRIQLTEKLCDDLGGNLYPAFLQILYKVEQHAEPDARKLVTTTLVYALRTGRLPAGKLSAWGASTLQTDTAFGQSRNLGPIEYLCTWYAQPTGQPPMTKAAFTQMATSLLRLIESDKDAKSMYCMKLAADAEDPLSGSMSSRTRSGLSVLANTWAGGAAPDDAVEQYLNALQETSLLDQLSIGRPPDAQF